MSLLEMGTKLFGISKKKTAGIVTQVHDAIGDWVNVFVECIVPEVDINRLAKDINQRLAAK